MHKLRLIRHGQSVLTIKNALPNASLNRACFAFRGASGWSPPTQDAAEKLPAVHDATAQTIVFELPAPLPVPPF